MRGSSILNSFNGYHLCQQSKSSQNKGRSVHVLFMAFNLFLLFQLQSTPGFRSNLAHRCGKSSVTSGHLQY